MFLHNLCEIFAENSGDSFSPVEQSNKNQAETQPLRRPKVLDRAVPLRGIGMQIIVSWSAVLSMNTPLKGAPMGLAHGTSCANLLQRNVARREGRRGGSRRLDTASFVPNNLVRTTYDFRVSI